MKKLIPIRIAVADNHTLFRTTLCELLTNMEFEVIIQAAHGKDLLEQLLFTTPLPEICLLDINMPVMDGMETARHIKTKWPQIKILAFSFSKTKKEIKQILENGADAFLSKGCEPAELKQTLLRLVQS